MKSILLGIAIGVIVGVLFFSIGSIAFARSNVAAPHGGGDTFLIDWYTIDGGGVMDSTSANFSLSGTIGQPDAGSMNSGSYNLNGGFWFGPYYFYKIDLPLVLKNG
jgi:hypothetical protein